jgi:hypothetical protein
MALVYIFINISLANCITNNSDTVHIHISDSKNHHLISNSSSHQHNQNAHGNHSDDHEKNSNSDSDSSNDDGENEDNHSHKDFPYHPKQRHFQVLSSYINNSLPLHPETEFSFHFTSPIFKPPIVF